MILVVGALAVLGLRVGDPPVRPELPPENGEGPESTPDPGPAGDGTIRPVASDVEPAGSGAGRVSSPMAIPDGPVRSFHGAALIQHEGELVREAAAGTIELDLLHRGARKRVVATVSGGRFAIDVPVAARLLLVGGRFEDQDVHFEAPRGPFDPTDDDYALIGMVTRRFELDVRDGGQGSPVAGVTVRRAEDATSAVLGDEGGPAGELVLEGATSPVWLPHIDAKRPVWLSVSAPGYAPTHVLVDPRKSGEKVVNLWPSADLTVRVTGAERGRLRMLVLTRDEGSGRTPHAGAFGVADPAVQSGPGEVLFPIRGLAAIPHTIQAKGYDPRGVTVDLGEPVRVDLGPGDSRTIEVRLDPR
jgi:hypothetical protein